MIETNLKTRDYSPHEAVRIVNHKQYLLYIKNNVYPVDMYTSIDDKTNNVIWQWYFLKQTLLKYIKSGVIMS